MAVLTKPEYIHIIGTNKKKDEGKSEGDEESLSKALSLATGLGMQIAFPIVVGVAFGHWIDKFSNSQPRFTLSFLFFGLMVSFYTLFKQVKTK